MPTVGLKTLTLKATSPDIVSGPVRPHKKRVFTEDEYKFLNTRSTEDLFARVLQGRRLIELLHRPDMLNMTPKSAAYYSSNLKYQIDEIYVILKSRGITL